jgi:hypothetical protein
MIAECMTNDGFEDQLTSSTQYKVKEIGANDYLIENDQSQERWYGSARFKIQLPK